MFVSITSQTPKFSEVASGTNSVPEANEILNFFWEQLQIFWWLIVPFFLFLILWRVWVEYVQDRFDQKLNYLNLAVDVPEEMELGPEAIEQIFAGFYGGVETNPNSIERYWDGRRPEKISCEITGIDGFIRFIIRVPDFYRDMAEAQVYSQYPQAQITEIPDYTTDAPDKWPDEEYEMFGADYVLTKEDAYPIRTYLDFLSSAKDVVFNDPLASLTEGLSKLKEGEQVWIQLIIRPAGEDWHEEGVKLAKKLIGAKVEMKKNLMDKSVENLLINPLHAVQKGLETSLGSQSEEIKKNEEPISLMQFLSPGEKNVVEALEKNIGRQGFKVSFRFIYLAKKDLFSPPKGVRVVNGAVKQFSTLDLNGFKMYNKTRTKIDYIFVKTRENRRKRKIMRRYKQRNMDKKPRQFILSTAELATVFHFPFTSVKAPMVERTESKKSQPPIELPMEEI